MPVFRPSPEKSRQLYYTYITQRSRSSTYTETRKMFSGRKQCIPIWCQMHTMPMFRASLGNRNNSHITHQYPSYIQKLEKCFLEKKKASQFDVKCPRWPSLGNRNMYIILTNTHHFGCTTICHDNDVTCNILTNSHHFGDITGCHGNDVTHVKYSTTATTLEASLVAMAMV